MYCSIVCGRCTKKGLLDKSTWYYHVTLPFPFRVRDIVSTVHKNRGEQRSRMGFCNCHVTLYVAYSPREVIIHCLLTLPLTFLQRRLSNALTSALNYKMNVWNNIYVSWLKGRGGSKFFGLRDNFKMTRSTHFGLLYSSWLQYSQCFGRCALRLSSSVFCRIL